MHFRANGIGEIVPDFFSPGKALGRVSAPAPAPLPAKSLGRVQPKAGTNVTAQIAPPRVSFAVPTAATPTAPPKVYVPPGAQSSTMGPNVSTPQSNYTPPYAPPSSAPPASSVVGGAGSAPIVAAPASNSAPYYAPTSDPVPPSIAPSGDLTQAPAAADLQKSVAGALRDDPWPYVAMGVAVLAIVGGGIYLATR